MPHASTSARIAASADALWKRIGPFAAIGNWHPMIDELKCDNAPDGSIRTVVTVTGDQQVERLQEWDGKQRFYRYRLERSALPVRDCTGELRVIDNGDGTSTVRWSSDFRVADGNDEGEIVGNVQTFLKAGLDNLAEWHKPSR